MSYIFKQKFRLEDLVELPPVLNRVLIYEPNDYLGGIYRHYLQAHNLETQHCMENSGIRQALLIFTPALLIYNAELSHPEQHIKVFAQEFPKIKIITTGYNLNQEEVSRLMAQGVISHINRRFSRPQDLAMLAKSFINH